MNLQAELKRLAQSFDANSAHNHEFLAVYHAAKTETLESVLKTASALWPKSWWADQAKAHWPIVAGFIDSLPDCGYQSQIVVMDYPDGSQGAVKAFLLP